MNPKILKLRTLILLLAVLTILQCCKEPDCLEEQEYLECIECLECPDEPELFTLFDTLRGEWNWIYTKNYVGTTVPYYPITVHFLSMNNDSSINYVTFKNDTIKKYGRFTIQPHVWGRRIKPDILVHYNTFGNLLFDFESKDTIRFYEFAEDGSYHYYKKLNP